MAKINYKDLEGTVKDGVYVHNYYRVQKVSEAGKKYSVGYLTVALEEYIQRTLDITLSRWKKWDFIDDLKQLTGEIVVDNEQCIECLECVLFNKCLFTADGVLVEEEDFIEKHFRKGEPFDGEQYLVKMATTFKQDCEELDLAYDDNFMYEAKKCWFDNGVDWIVEDLIEPNLEEIDALLETLEEGEEYDLTDAEDLEDVLAGFDESIEALTNIAQELRQYNYAA
jgi:hypothetical protein